jgi:hypothetical protein
MISTPAGKVDRSATRVTMVRPVSSEVISTALPGANVACVVTPVPAPAVNAVSVAPTPWAMRA